MADRTLSAYSLLSLDETLRACGIATSPAPTGDTLNKLLDVAERVTDEIEAFLERQIVTRGSPAITEYHTLGVSESLLGLQVANERQGAVLQLGQFPIIAITSVAEGAWAAGTWTASYTLTSSDYTADTAAGRLIRRSGGDTTSWASGFDSVKVVYTAGYSATATVPQRIKRVAAALAARMWGGEKRGYADAQSVNDGLGSITRFMPAELLRMERAALASERRYFTTGRV